MAGRNLRHMMYAIPADEISKCTGTDSEMREWCFLEHTPENVRRLAGTQKGKMLLTWKPLLILQKEEAGQKWMKGAFLNPATREIALMSSSNAREHIEGRGWKAGKTHDKEWFLFCHGMTAPGVFWSELAKRV